MVYIAYGYGLMAVEKSSNNYYSKLRQDASNSPTSKLEASL